MCVRVLLVLPAMAAVFISAGCGESEEERIQEVVRQYHKASIDGDADKACALTAPEMFVGTGATCEDVVRINSLPTDASWACAWRLATRPEAAQLPRRARGSSPL